MSARVVGYIRGSGRFDRAIASVARLGATSENEVAIPIDGVSRQHAKITEEADGFWIEDANSKNGTWVNGERTTKRQKLNHLDVITLGRFAEMVFLIREAEPATVRAALHARIEWLNGPSAGTFVDISQGETILGRADSCGIIVDDGAISRAHVRLTHTGDRLTIEDLGSANGTAVNHRPLTAASTLESGAEVELGGERRFRVHLEGGVAGTAPAASGPASAPAQDMEWMTRLVWSESDLEAVRAGLVAAGESPSGKRDKTKPRITPAADAQPQRASPVPSAAPPAPATPVSADTPKTSLSPPPTPAVAPVAVQSPGTGAQTLLGRPALGAPPVPSPGAPTVAGTVIDEPELGRPPAIGQGAAQVTSLDIGGPTGGPPGELGRRPPAPPRAPVQRPDLPPATVLGYRDVAPGAPRSGISAPRTDVPSSTPDVTHDAIRGVRLTGTVGTFDLPVGTVGSIGRSEQATVRIDSRDVSRVHAVLTVTEQGVVLEDKGSVNGTLLNGAPLLGTHPLGDGDHIAIADFEFYVEFLRTEAKP